MPEKYGIGLDIGIGSVGWATVGLDIYEQPYCLLDTGVRVFDVAENPKTGASLALPRRLARGTRRRIRRHHHRNDRIREALVKNGLAVDKDSINNVFTGTLPDIYELRVAALDRNVTDAEFCRILIHLSQRRGFKSNGKGDKTGEDGKLLLAVSNNQKRMNENGYRTIAEMFLKDETFSYHKRNKKSEYLSTVTRDSVEDEVHKIFAAQRSFGNDKASEQFETDYLEILLSQRSFDEGPGKGSPYGGNQIEKMIGHCTFFPEEKRAAKATYTCQYFTLLEKLNHIRILGSNGEVDALTPQQRKSLIELTFKSDDVSYAKIRKLLNIPEDSTFNMVYYKPDESVEGSEKKEKFNYLKSYHQLRKALNNIDKTIFPRLTEEMFDIVGSILSVYKTDENIYNHLIENKIPSDIAKAITDTGVNFSKFGNLSIKAYQMLIPFLEEGCNYNEACEKAGIDFHGHSNSDKDVFLRPKSEDYDDISSPVAKRAISQTFKVINAIIRKQGCSPDYINIELARDLSKSKQERDKITRSNEGNRERNEKILEKIKNEFGKQNPSGLDIVKLKLFEEQDGISPYSPTGKRIDLSKLFEPGYVDIDHIVPYSKTFDDRYSNKVLVFASENREKGDCLPLEYLTGKEKENFLVWVNNNVKNTEKKRNLLRESLPDDVRKQFIDRNIQDTRIISIFVMNYIRDHLVFAESKRKNHVTALSGGVTAYMRQRWGVSKIRENGDTHHAVDAAVIACITPGLIKTVSAFSKWRECRYLRTAEGSIAVHPYTGEVLKAFPMPWKTFHEDLYNSVEKIFVSRMPNRKLSGPAHKETVKSVCKDDPILRITKRNLSDLKLDKKTGEIENYYKPESDIALYNAIKERLQQFDGDGKKAFAEPLRKPGSPDRFVSKIKVFEKTTLDVPVYHGNGYADNGSMSRIDVYKVNDKYYFVPIYVSDLVKKELPRMACVSAKPYSEWKKMDASNFLFSLYPNDLIYVKYKKPLNLQKVNEDSNIPEYEETFEAFLYNKGMDISKSSLSGITHDNTYKVKTINSSFIINLEKHDIDVLGLVS